MKWTCNVDFSCELLTSVFCTISNDDPSFHRKVLLGWSEVLMRDDGWETPCLQLRFIPLPLPPVFPPTKHRYTMKIEIQIQIDVRETNTITNYGGLPISDLSFTVDQLKDLSDVSSKTNTVEFFDKYKCPTGLMMSCLQLTSISHQPDTEWKMCQTFDGSKRRKKRNADRHLEELNALPRAEKSQFSFRCWSTMRNLIVDCRLEIVRSVKTVWETSPAHTFSLITAFRAGFHVWEFRLQGFVNSCHYSPEELHHLRSNSIWEGRFHLHHPPPPSLTSHALDVQSRICKSDLIPRRLPRRIFGHDFTVWRWTATDGRPDTHSDPDATLCRTSTRWRQGCFKHFLASTDKLKSYEKPLQLDWTTCLCSVLPYSFLSPRAILATFEATDLSHINWQGETCAI